MGYRISWWKHGERIDGREIRDDRQATLHAALHLLAGEDADEVRVMEYAPEDNLFGYDSRVILKAVR